MDYSIRDYLFYAKLNKLGLNLTNLTLKTELTSSTSPNLTKYLETVKISEF